MVIRMEVQWQELCVEVSMMISVSDNDEHGGMTKAGTALS